MTRPLSQDESEIHQLLAEYCQYCDDGNFDALVDCFTQEASFVFEHRTASGADELRQWFERTQSPERRGKHISANAIVRVDGEGASATSDFTFLVRSGQDLKTLMAGRYIDDLVFAGGRWRFTRREVISL